MWTKRNLRQEKKIIAMKRFLATSSLSELNVAFVMTVMSGVNIIKDD